MTLEETKKRVADLIANHGDSDIAHGMEDKLMKDFISAVASLEVDLFELGSVAQEITKVFALDFPRYTA